MSIVKKIPDWSGFKALGNSKIIKSSYWWLFIVPILAKILESTGDSVDITIFNATFKITLNLPFSWSLFYFSAVCFSIASLIYLFNRPQVVNDYKNYEEWDEFGRGSSSLIRVYMQLYRNPSHEITDKSKDFFIKNYLEYKGDLSKITKESGTPLKLVMAGIPEKNRKTAYYHVFDILKQSNVTARRLLILFYTIGFGFFITVLVQNFIYVCQHL